MGLFVPPMNYAIAVLLALLGLWAARWSARLVARGLRDGHVLEVVRGIRVCILALVADLGAIGLWFATPGFLTIGAIILGEELYETGVLIALIRVGERQARAGA